MLGRVRHVPRALRKRISELEAKNKALRELLEVLQSLPAVMEQKAARSGSIACHLAS